MSETFSSPSPPPLSAAARSSGEAPRDSAWPEELRFPGGLPGFPSARRFRLTPLSTGGPAFARLESLEDPKLAFVVAPLGLEQRLIDRESLEPVRAALAIPEERLRLLLVLRLERENGTLRAYANVRAPIFVDLATGRAAQCVLPDPRYPLRLPLLPEEGAAQPAATAIRGADRCRAAS